MSFNFLLLFVRIKNSSYYYLVLSYYDYYYLIIIIILLLLLLFVLVVQIIVIVPSPGIWIAVTESMNRGVGKISEWCDLWGMKLNAGKTTTMIVAMSRTMFPSHPH